MRVVCIDSEIDVATKQVADWRRANTYPLIQNYQSTILKGNMAVRVYLQRELLKSDVVFLTGSGHGLYGEFQGNDGLAALEVGGYSPAEVTDKIIHLLSCNTAFDLGPDVVNNGCKAFFGYDFPFAYHIAYIDMYLQPDQELVLAIINGSTAQVAHQRVVAKYMEMIDLLKKQGANEYVISDMETDFEHFCSPVKDARWGNINAAVLQSA